MNGSMLKITRIFVCKCQYLSLTLAKFLFGIKMVEKQKTGKNQQKLNNCNMCNHIINITLYCITTKKRLKRDKEHN